MSNVEKIQPFKPFMNFLEREREAVSRLSETNRGERCHLITTKEVTTVATIQRITELVRRPKRPITLHNTERTR